MTVYVVVLVALLAWSLVSVLRVRRDWPSSPTRIWLVAPTVLAASATLIVTSITVEHVQRERMLTDAVQQITGSDHLSLSCQTLDEHLLLETSTGGWWVRGSTTGTLTYDVCRDLHDYARSDEVRSHPTVWHSSAIRTLLTMSCELQAVPGHEMSECTSDSNMARVKRILGANEEQVQASFAAP